MEIEFHYGRTPKVRKPEYKNRLISVISAVLIAAAVVLVFISTEAAAIVGAGAVGVIVGSHIQRANVRIEND